MGVYLCIHTVHACAYILTLDDSGCRFGATPFRAPSARCVCVCVCVCVRVCVCVCLCVWCHFVPLRRDAVSSAVGAARCQQDLKTLGSLFALMVRDQKSALVQVHTPVSTPGVPPQYPLSIRTVPPQYSQRALEYPSSTLRVPAKIARSRLRPQNGLPEISSGGRFEMR
jgi:hypothetical protein